MVVVGGLLLFLLAGGFTTTFCSESEQALDDELSLPEDVGESVVFFFFWLLTFVVFSKK